MENFSGKRELGFDVANLPLTPCSIILRKNLESYVPFEGIARSESSDDADIVLASTLAKANDTIGKCNAKVNLNQVPSKSLLILVVPLVPSKILSHIYSTYFCYLSVNR